MRPHEPLVLRLAWGKGMDLQKEIEEIRINKKLKQVKKKKEKAVMRGRGMCGLSLGPGFKMAAGR